MSEQTVTVSVGRRRWRRRLWRRLWVGRRAVLPLLVLGTVLLFLPYTWTEVAADGNVYTEAQAPAADVVLVLGAQVAPGGADPMPVLRGRLDTAAALVRDGRARVILVSGDGTGRSGDETTVMTSYLTRLGIDPARVVADPAGLDTYDSCLRAKEVYGLSRALVVTQSYHLDRAVALCRHVGIDADGVMAGCPTCRRATLFRNALRDVLACVKAGWDALTDRRPAIESPPSSALTDALATNPR